MAFKLFTADTEFTTRPGKHYLLTVKALCDTVIKDCENGEKGQIHHEISTVLKNYEPKCGIDWASK